MSLLVLPRQLVVDINGTPRVGAQLFVYDAGTSTPRPTYPTVADAAAETNALPFPVPSISTGLFPATYVNTADGPFKIVLKDSADVTLYTEDNIAVDFVLTSVNIATTLNSLKRTAAEIAASVTPTDYAYQPGDIRRYGATSGADNTAAIQAACDSATAGDTVRLTVNGLIIAPIVITIADIEIEGCGRIQQHHPSYNKGAAGPDWAFYNQMFVVNADRVFIKHVRFYGGIITATATYFSGSFVWFASGVSGGGVEECFFYNLRYDASNSVAIQTRSTSVGISIKWNKFTDCCGSVSLQGFYSTCAYNITEVTNALGAAPLTDVLGVTDQPYGTDGSTGCSVIGNKVYITSGAPYSGAIIGANVGSVDFTIAHNTIYGLTGGVALFIRACANGTVAHNIIDGAGYSTAIPWCFLRVDADCSGVDVTANTLKGPLTGAGTGLGMDVATGGNTCKDNKVLFGTTSVVLLNIPKATAPAESVFEGNYLRGGGIGTKLDLSDNILASTGIEVPIIHRNNTFATPVTTPYSCTGVSRQIKFYIEDDKLLSTAYNASAVILTSKLNRMFRTGLAANFGFRVGINVDIHSTEVPSGVNYYLATYETGDIIYHSQTVAGGSEGWKCTTGGTIPDGTPYSQAGTSTNGSPIITALANTTLVLVGDYVSPSAGFATTGPYKVIAKTATTLTLDTNSNAGASPTVTHFAPVFKALAAVAA